MKLRMIFREEQLVVAVDSVGDVFHPPHPYIHHHYVHKSRMYFFGLLFQILTNASCCCEIYSFVVFRVGRASSVHKVPRVRCTLGAYSLLAKLKPSGRPVSSSSWTRHRVQGLWPPYLPLQSTSAAHSAGIGRPAAQ